MKKGISYFNGKYFIIYNHKQFLREDILDGFIQTSQWIKKNPIQPDFVKIRLDRNIDQNSYFYRTYGKSNKTLIEIKLILKDFNLNNITSVKKDPEFNIIPLSEKTIKNIVMASPALSSDQRWKTIDLPSSSFFIASMLVKNSFNVSVKKIELPNIKHYKDFNKYDLSGFTLYEDLFTEFKEFVSEFNKNNKNLKAAGGPLVTLSPLEALCFLPEINLFVRGESEFVLPEILAAINNNDTEALMVNRGFVFQKPGILIISDFNVINRPSDLSGIDFDLSFIKKEQMKNGIEINFSRGCINNCIFCSKVQGKTVRQLPIENIEKFLESYSSRSLQFGIRSEANRTININDDDILQDEIYSKKVFNVIKKKGFSLWGIQSSISSFYSKDKLIDKNKISIIADKEIYTGNKALLWLGTDTFISKRAKRLGKPFPYDNVIFDLVEEFEKHEIANYHYWISSDFNSTWEEFIKEIKIIYHLKKNFKNFSLLPHSPFLIPYSSTPLYKYLTETKGMGSQVKLKKKLKCGNELFDFPLISRVETRFKNLNRLLNNESMPGRKGFFTYLKADKYSDSFITAYEFLKSDRIYMESENNPEVAERLMLVEENLGDFIAKLI
ncbi:MAG: hypothetical protein ABFR75_07585 [Acidobacteriota bacterium]